MEITLQPKELDLVRQVLANYLSDLRMEIADTDDHDYREGLKDNEAIIKSVLNRLERSGVSSS